MSERKSGETALTDPALPDRGLPVVRINGTASVSSVSLGTTTGLCKA